MNGYGQQITTPEQLSQALSQFDKLQRQQQAVQTAMRSGNPYQAMGAQLGRGISQLFGKDKDVSLSALDNQIQQYHQSKEAEAAQREQMKKAAEMQKQQQQQLKALVPQFGEQGARAIVFGGAKPSDVKADKTSVMQNAEAMGLKPGTPQYNAYIQQASGKPVTNVNVNSGTKYGKIPEGYMLKETPQGAQMVPIGGSPAEREQQQAKTKAASRGYASAFEGDNINNVIDQVIEETSGWTTGAGGSVLGAIPGTPARDLQENLKTIQADAAFSSLQEMRDNSPTGGALGQVSERELGLLSSARAALDASQSPEQFKQNLMRYKNVRNKAMESVARAYEADYGEPAPWLKQEKQEAEPQSAESKTINGRRFEKRNGEWYEL